MAQQNNLDFNIAANVKGMEQIATLINRVNALEAETKKLASANANLTNSNNSVIQSGTRYNNALDAQSKQLRNARQGTQQLGMQINDFATSVATGSSITQAFNQQLGQVGYAMSMMGGTAGKVGAFLAGPWGAAITIGVMALGTLIDKLWQSKDAAEQAAKAHRQYMQAVSAGQMSELIKAEGQLTTLQNRRMRLQIELDKTPLPSGSGRFGVPGERTRLQQQINRLNSEISFLQMAIDSGNEALDKLSKAESAAKTNAGVGGSASRGGGGMSSAMGEAQKAAAAANRYYANLQGEYVKEYQDYRVMMIKSDEAWAEKLAKIEDESSRNSIDSAAQRAKEIGYISEDIGKKVAADVDAPIKAVQDSFVSIGNSVSDVFKGMLTGAMSWKDGMRSLIGSVIDELWRLYVVQQIVGMVTSFLGGTTGATAARLAPSATATIAANAPLFANGTVNAPGGMAWVGERGPELVNLPRGSQVIPAHRAQSMGGGGVTVNVDARGSADPAAVRAQVEAGIMQAAPAIIAAAQQRTVAGLRRPKLGGAMQ